MSSSAVCWRATWRLPRGPRRCSYPASREIKSREQRRCAGPGSYGTPALACTAAGEEQPFCYTFDRCRLDPVPPTVSPRSGRDPSPRSDLTPVFSLAALVLPSVWRGLRFATTTGGQQTSIPPVAPSVAASKHKSARIETRLKGTTTDINNA